MYKCFTIFSLNVQTIKLNLAAADRLSTWTLQVMIKLTKLDMFMYKKRVAHKVHLVNVKVFST